uniref:ATP synthase complex subunit 8 n=1 Tax=Hydrosaurus amboinensis TaxID=588074 RepID=D6RS39_9SAUR|nr:ATP synthase F0 subunit 8 [Hydrosaurus amboinensis]BAJ08129.1 ATPase subunit 8 [Hydrosaurus amboinensis]
MPQLNPAPWLLMMTMTWLAMFTLMTKITNNATNILPTPKNNKMNQPQWTWPW